MTIITLKAFENSIPCKRRTTCVTSMLWKGRLWKSEGLFISYPLPRGLVMTCGNIFSPSNNIKFQVLGFVFKCRSMNPSSYSTITDVIFVIELFQLASKIKSRLNQRGGGSRRWTVTCKLGNKMNDPFHLLILRLNEMYST